MKAIGGYFELELPAPHDFPHSHGVLLNSGRHALEYILASLHDKPAKVWIPRYTCHVVLQPFQRLGITTEFYDVDRNLEIRSLPQLADGEYIVANNYFGVKDSYMSELYRIYADKLIIDCAQAFYMDDIPGAKTIYSPRKFFGVPACGIAVTPDTGRSELPSGQTYDRCIHLLKRIDVSSSAAYADFRNNDSAISEETPQRISNLALRMLRSVDYDDVRTKRLRNYRILHEALQRSNRLTLPPADQFSCPMVYPYMTDSDTLRQTLIDNNIFVATYWPNVYDWSPADSTEYRLAKYLLPLPIDQRYDTADMQRILSILPAQ